MYSCVLLGILAVGVSGSVDPGKIAGGELAKEGEFPWIVSVDRNGRHTCGGAIIAKKWILTAAHCIKKHDPSIMTILAGTTRRSENGTRYQVSRGIMHDPEWDAANFGNDIGLLRLTKDIEYNNLIKPIALNSQYVKPGTILTLAGWGRLNQEGHSVDDLHWINLTSISQEKCQKRHHHTVRDYMMCTFTTKGEGSCKGDSGSPLILNGKVAGLSSWGKICGGGYPNVYTRVSYFLKWIQDTMAKYDNSILI